MDRTSRQRIQRYLRWDRRDQARTMRELKRLHGMTTHRSLNALKALWKGMDKHNVPNDVKRLIIDNYWAHGAMFPNRGGIGRLARRYNEQWLHNVR